MTELFDLTILGAGPAGAEAAIDASHLGLRVVVLDEAPAAGGQVYRAPQFEAKTGRVDPHHAEGNALRERLERSGATFLRMHRVWDIGLAGQRDTAQYTVSTMGPSGLTEIRSRALLAATGVTERFYARPGWTLPGVIGLGAATAMLKSAQVLPGRSVVVAGVGPLLSLVAHLIIQGGGKVAAVVDVSPLSEWLGHVPAMMSRPDLLARGAKWQFELAYHRVPVYRGYDISRIIGTTEVEAVELGRLGAYGKLADLFQIEADAVCMSYGLTPATEVFRLLGADQVFNEDRGGWVPVLDDCQRTSVPGLYAAGDGAGLLGAAAAPLTGALASLAVAFDLERISPAEFARSKTALDAKLRRAAKFGAAMAKMARPRPALMAAISDSTVVCRCEDITAGELRQTIQTGAKNINALKFATRCGMGPCGGRVCGEAAAAMLECHGVQRGEIQQFTARPPLRPILLADVTRDFEYSDIPLPEPAPA